MHNKEDQIMGKASSNADLHAAKKSKQDDFYTQLSDVEKELKFHKKSVRNKTIICNCDDPRVSNFFHYFSYNFEQLKLKKLISVCYKNNQTDLFSQNNNEKAVFLEYTGDKNGDNIPNLEEIDVLPLKGDGDFRSKESINLLKKSDIVITNPPFSLFREFLDQTINHNKKFLILGNVNAISYKEVFKLIMENKVWLGASIHSGDREFGVPRDLETRSKSLRIDENGNKFIRVPGIRWFTNLDYKQRYEDLILYKKYTPEEYPKYDNYDAINVNITKEIPMDYDGIMGVPITFLSKYNPDQFEILGLSQKVGYGLESTKFYDDYEETRQDGTKTGSSGKKTNGNAVLAGRPKKGNFYTKGNDVVHSLYGRIFIRNKRL